MYDMARILSIPQNRKLLHLLSWWKNVLVGFLNDPSELGKVEKKNRVTKCSYPVSDKALHAEESEFD